jgi:hypothetical protein
LLEDNPSPLTTFLLPPTSVFFGFELFDMARGVADFKLPARVGVGQLFGVSL